MNGRALTDLKDASGAVSRFAPAQLLDGFAQLRDDGSTASGCWIFSGCYTEKGNQMARRDASDPREQGIAPNWAWAWPANRRILYNRASADPEGKPWNPEKPIIEWNGSRWVGIDVPDYGPTTKPSDAVGPFIMNDEGVGRLFARDQMAEGPFPEHYEPFESPAENLLHPKVKIESGGARLRRRSCGVRRRGASSPMSATTYRLTEHFHFWTKHALINAILQPEEFVEIGEVLAKEKGIEQGGWVRVASKRGFVVCKAYVTKRIKPLMVDGKPTHVIGVSPALGFHRPGAQGLRRQHADALRRRRQLADAGVQGVPGQRRKDRALLWPKEALRWHRSAVSGLHQAFGDDDDAAVCSRPRTGSREADRRLPLHRLQGVPGGVHGVEQSAAGGRVISRAPTRIPRT